MKKYVLSLAGIALVGVGALFMSGCMSPDEGNISGTAYLVDSNVSGVSYHCGQLSGTTGVNGSFSYQKGQDCVFSIGATTFTLSADKLKNGKDFTPFDLFSEDDEKAINLARFLQTLDSDNNVSNGIDINATAHLQVKHQIEFGPNFDANLTSELNGSVYQNQIRTRMQAMEHLASTVGAITRSTFTVFERIAEIDASSVKTASGFSNPTDQARYVAQKIAKYYNDVNDLNTGYSIADWILAGSTITGKADSNATVYNPYILEIPSPDNNKTMIVEVCNKTHAGGAIAGSTIPGGEGHAAALPCEIAIYTDTVSGKIYVDILDPVGSFAIFFNDLGTNAAMSAMALQVKTEIKLITYKGLDEGALTYTRQSTPMGPVFSADEIKAMSNQYVTYTYDINTSDAGWQNATTQPAKRAMALNAAQKLIEKMTVNIPSGYTSAYVNSPYVAAGSFGVNGTDLNATLVGNADYNLSEKGYWRSARLAALSVPRDVNTSAYGFVYTVEACSPTYAKLALSMGGDSRNHATALPCQMSFYIDDSDANATKLKVVFLNPEFMFQTLFKDKLAGLSTTDQTTLSAMATTVKNDLVNLTRYVMDNSGLGWIVPFGK